MASLLFLFPFLLLITILAPASAIYGGGSATPSFAARSFVLIEIEDARYFRYGSGALINERIVLASALVCKSMGPTSALYMGSVKVFENARVYFAKRVEYLGSSSDYRFNLCLILLDRIVPLSQTLLPVALPNDKDYPRKTTQLYAFGAGATVIDKNELTGNLWPAQFQHSMTVELQRLAMQHYKVQDCKKIYNINKGDVVNDKMALCLGNSFKVELLMWGDMGAPIIDNKEQKLYGIAVDLFSFVNVSDYQASKLFFAVNVQTYTNEILLTMGKLMESI